MTDQEILEAGYRIYLLRQIHDLLKERERAKSKALLEYTTDVTFTLRWVDGNTTTFTAKGVTIGLDPGRSGRVARRRTEVVKR